MEHEYIIHLVNPGPRPPYYLVAEHLWGPGCDVDSDGDSDTPEDSKWVELSLFLRGATKADQVHIDPVSEDPLVLAVRSPSQSLCERVVTFLLAISGGSIEKAA